MRTPPRKFVIKIGSLLLAFVLGSCLVNGKGNNRETSGDSHGVASAQPENIKIKLVTVAKGFQNPVHLVAVPGDLETFYVVEQRGVIQVVKNGKIQHIFLDIQDRVRSGGEMGLLSLAFHPDYLNNGRFFVNYTTKGNLKTQISEFKANIAQKKATAQSERVILSIAQPFTNHNGGQIAFGADGYLYIGMGDGGDGGDPQGNGQNTKNLLGALLRIDINGKQPYAIPPDNPFHSEIWAYGLRNPWRFSFDRQTARLYVADVGQDKYEEINLVEKGKNYGWNIMEGNHCYQPASNCNRQGLVLPIAEYDHTQGISVTGGHVYRGNQYPSLEGIYFYADFGSGQLWGLKYDGQKVLWNQKLLKTGLNISSFGQDAAGEIYILDYGKGDVFRITG